MFEILVGVLVMGAFIGYIILVNKRKEGSHQHNDNMMDYYMHEDYNKDDGNDSD